MELGETLSRDSDVRRKYDSSRRQADAEARHQRIVEEATALFLNKGFGATSIGDIAAAAGVSPQTIYAAFGSKAGVLSRAIDVALVGDYDEVAAFDRAPSLEETADFTAYAHYLRTLNGRVAPLIRVMEQSAAAEPSLAELRSTLVEQIRSDCRRWIAQIGPKALRRGLTEEEAADVLALMDSPYIYSFFIHDLGWTADQYERWMAAALTQLLLRLT